MLITVNDIHNLLHKITSNGAGKEQYWVLNLVVVLRKSSFTTEMRYNIMICVTGRYLCIGIGTCGQ